MLTRLRQELRSLAKQLTDNPQTCPECQAFTVTTGQDEPPSPWPCKTCGRTGPDAGGPLVGLHLVPLAVGPAATVQEPNDDDGQADEPPRPAPNSAPNSTAPETQAPDSASVDDLADDDLEPNSAGQGKIFRVRLLPTEPLAVKVGAPGWFPGWLPR